MSTYSKSELLQFARAIKRANKTIYNALDDINAVINNEIALNIDKLDDDDIQYLVGNADLESVIDVKSYGANFENFSECRNQLCEKIIINI